IIGEFGTYFHCHFSYYSCSLSGRLRSLDPNSGAHRSSSKDNPRWPQRRRKPPPAPQAPPLSLAVSSMALNHSTKEPTHELKTSPTKLLFMEIRLITLKTPKLINSQKQHSSSRPLK